MWTIMIKSEKRKEKNKKLLKHRNSMQVNITWSVDKQ
uniref:Uncharacterized protein n=1 Tax=Anguilla anguilla TaxID=7936 RepID=A0A0E9TDY3_ANGAN